MRRFGLTWVEDINTFTIAGAEFGEAGWYSQDFTPLNGGTYYILHDDETGLWDVVEMGGRGPNVWDREVEDRMVSPLAAMKAAKDDYLRQARIVAIWESEEMQGVWA